LKLYPDNVECLSDLSIVYTIRKQYDDALEVLLKAYKLAPKDHIVQANIANTYRLKGDKKNAIKYYELMAINGDEDSKIFAEGEIKKLKK